jgi:hypothetical protein
MATHRRNRPAKASKRTARLTAGHASPSGRGGKTPASPKSSAARSGKAAATRSPSARRKPAPRRPPRPLTERVTARVGKPADQREETIRTLPSSLNLDRHPSAAASGRRELAGRLGAHTSTGPAMTGGDVDADWEGAYSVGEEAAGGDNPTPDQQIVDDIGRAIGVEYQESEELQGATKIERRDHHRWELDPASSEDYRDRTKRRGRLG